MSGSVKYLKSAVLPKDYPEASRPEVALLGRSNAGKSSFLNAIAKSKIAHVSQTPGKTRLLNFFDFGQHYRIVDMPGYGFAARSGSEQQEWTGMVENYLSTRGTLKGVVLLMDIRREWSEDERLLKDFTDSLGLPMVVLLTKKDKCTSSEVKSLTAKIKKSAGLESIFSISSTTREGAQEIRAVEDFIFQNWVKAK